MSAYDEMNDDGYAQAPTPEDGSFEEVQPEAQKTAGGPLLDDDFAGDGPILPPPSAMDAEESLLLREWRRKKALELDEKARISREKHDQVVAEAKQEQTSFYDRRKQTMAQAKLSNRDKEKVFLTSLESLNAKKGGNTWEAATAFINFDTMSDKKTKNRSKGEPKRTSTLLQTAKPGKHTDMTRMRQVLIKLKHSPPVRAT